jgi:hypothetical protein
MICRASFKISLISLPKEEIKDILKTVRKNNVLTSSPPRGSKPLSASYVKIMTASTFYSCSVLNPKVVNDLLPYRVNIYPPPPQPLRTKTRKEEFKKGENTSNGIEMSLS